MPHYPPDQTLNEVSTVLWRERQLLDLLLFKMQEEQLILAAGKTRWLPNATREVELVLEKLRAAEILRAVQVDTLAAEIGLEPAPSLRLLADTLPEPWSIIFFDHRQAFLAVTGEIARMAEVNRELIGSHTEATKRVIGWMTGHIGEGTSYTATGTVSRERAGHLLLNEAL